MKKILVIIGIGLVSGTVLSLILNKKDKLKNNVNKISSDIPLKNNNLIINKNTNTNYDSDNDFNEFKNSVVDNISKRHEYAANIMRESIDNINRNTEDFMNCDSDLDKISDELDTLLREDK